MTVFIQVPDKEAKKIDKFATEHNLSLQELFLESVLKRVEAESDIGNFTNLLTQYTENETEYSFDELQPDKK